MPFADKWLDDGFGNCWIKCDVADCALQIVRPGKVQCDHAKCGATDWAKKHGLDPSYGETRNDGDGGKQS